MVALYEKRKVNQVSSLLNNVLNSVDADSYNGLFNKIDRTAVQVTADLPLENQQSDTTTSNDGLTEQVLRNLNPRREMIALTANRIGRQESKMFTPLTDSTPVHRRTLARNSISYIASHDSLTGLINRCEFDKRLQEALFFAKREVSYGFCYIDVDHFKVINESVGHQAGDELLKQIADLITQILPSTGIFARLGGDEFGILLKNCSRSNAVLFANKVVALLNDHSFDCQDHTFTPCVSIGIVMLTAQTDTCDQLLSHADLACYLAKDLGGNQACLYQQSNRQLAQRQREINLIFDLNSAIDEQRFSLVRQRIMRTSSSEEEAGLEKRDEILLRLNDRNGNPVSPALFVAAAERFNMMPEIDLWVVRTLLENYHEAYQEQVILNINLSGNTLNDTSALNEIVCLVRNSNVPPQSLCFEITETAVVSTLSEALKFISTMRDLGCAFALDDFGTGLCSLSYLQQFPIDFIKIDGCFIKNLNKDFACFTMIKAMIQIGQDLGLKTVAECVEDAESIAILAKLGIDYVQGYAVERPQPLSLKSQ